MIKKYAVAGIAAFLVVISTNVFAEEKKQELSVFGFISSPSEPAGLDSTILMNATAGHYFTQQFLGTMTVTMLGSGDFSLVGFGFGGKYYFSDGKKGDTVPFVLAELMLARGYTSSATSSTDLTSTEFVFGVGAAHFLTETASIDVRYALKTGSTTSTTDSWVFPYGSSSSTYDSASTELTFGFTQRF